MSAPHKYKLTYFDIRGLGECIKYIFAYKNIPYELETIKLFTLDDYKTSVWFDKTKQEMPFGQLPILDIDGEKRLYQSIAICYYLGKEHGLGGDSILDDTELIAIASAINDMHMRIAVYYYERTPEKKEQLKKDRINVTIPFYFSRFENMLKENGDYMHGKLTWVDFYMVSVLEHVNGMMESDYVSGTYPLLEVLMKRVKSLPGVKEYIANRPHSPR